MIRRISADETRPLRLAILRPGMPPETASFPGDDDADTQHFGASANGGGELVGVASIFRAPLPERPELAQTWQLRGMATNKAVRGRGFGRALVAACVSGAREHGGQLLWCNARAHAAGFYAAQGWQMLGPEFDIPTVGPHFRMAFDLRIASKRAFPERPKLDG